MSSYNLFSAYAADYQAYRPDYPPELFSYLSSLTARHDLAWDCGTGNGQAAVGLAPYFSQIIASDLSAEQIQHAMQKPNIDYRVMPAEKTDLRDHSVDLITVATALHWFEFDPFYAEVNRVLKPDGVIAAWGYSLIRISPTFDDLIKALYQATAPYWSARRKYFDQAYRDIPFPWTDLTPPHFMIKKEWDFSQFAGYLHTWSGLRECIQQRGEQFIAPHFSALLAAWKDPAIKRQVTWKIFMRVGKKIISQK